MAGSNGSNGRARRPDLERVAPIRDFSRVLGPPVTNGPARGKRRREQRVDATATSEKDDVPRAREGRRQSRGDEPTGEPRGQGGRGGQDDNAPKNGNPRHDGDVRRGVGLGYQVIDDYLRQGEQFARALYGAPGSIGSPLRSGGERTADVGDLRTTAGRMFQVAADLVATWTDLMQSAATSGFGPGREPRRGGVPPFDMRTVSEEAERPSPEGSERSSPSSPRSSSSSSPAPGQNAPDERPSEHPAPVTIDVASRRRVEIAVDLSAGPTAGPLVVHDLRAPGPRAARIGGVVVEQVGAPGRATTARTPGFVVRIQIDDSQPAGVYAGLVVDRETNKPRGHLSVRVLADRQAAPRKSKR